MDVKEIITHLDNFRNTWSGWEKFLGGLVKFFAPQDGASNPISQLAVYFLNLGDNFQKLGK